MSAKSEFEYIQAHMGEVAWRDDEDQRELLAKGIAYRDQNSVRLYQFTGPQTYKKAATKAVKRCNGEEDER